MTTIAREVEPTTLTVNRHFSTEGTHPYDELEWERRDVLQVNRTTGETIFSQRGVEFPSSWSENASTIVTTKYFRGRIGSPERENSLKQLIDRVVDTYAAAAVAHGYMDEPNAAVFSDELKWLLVNQHFSFNSPVWFNVGTKSPQQVSACFILSVDDSMESILDWYKEEGLIFKGGSGAGLNLSKIRSSKELLASGGTASGPVSFMRGADASAGTIKSGGKNRRAAKMVVLDVDHPDIVDFVETKQREEKKINALREAGFDMELGGRDESSVQYQNANNSVSVTDEFMRAVENGSEFGLVARSTGEVIETVDARELFEKIAQAAWDCADPGLHYNDTMNAWHTCPATDRITASNPCSEYVFLDDTSCNLASLNLMKFVGTDGAFDAEKFVAAVEHVITAMEISIAFGDFPTEAITQRSKDYRPLGIGYANLGALLMSKGLAYDSPGGRGLAAGITSLMTGVAYRRSAEIAGIVGPYAGYQPNAEDHIRVMRKHHSAAVDLASDNLNANVGCAEDTVALARCEYGSEAQVIATTARDEWQRCLRVGSENGWRNAQASVLAPTGTIGFMMDCDTTGIEPDFSLLKFKKLADGGSMQIANTQVAPALRSLGYDDDAITAIEGYIVEYGNVVAAPGLDPAHYPVFDCAAGNPRSIEAMGHVRMMAAVQPFLSGAISKTVNLPSSATVEDIKQVYLESWKLGLKATAVYRDGCKSAQPLSDAKAKKDEAPAPEPVVEVVERIVEVPRREKLPQRRTASVTSFRVGEAHGYLTTGEYEDGRPGELFLKMSKQGSTLAGVMDAFSVAISIGLQYGVPLETYVAKFVNQRFAPDGMTDDPDVRMSQSIIDYVFRRLALDYLPFEARDVYGIYSTAERKHALDNNGVYEPLPAVDETLEEEAGDTPVAVPEVSEDVRQGRREATSEVGELCVTCGTPTQPAGACRICPSCGTSTGCS